MALSPALRSTLRLVFTVAVVQGFATLTGLPDILYASLAVLSVTVSTYGDTFELGRQRLIGTLAGALVLLVAYPAFQGLPTVVGLPLALAFTRLVTGGLRLTVGYAVGCMVVVMGWLVHENQLDSWIPLRLMWTFFGVLMTLWALRLFWPSLARQQQRQGLQSLLGRLEGAWGQYRLQQPVAVAPLRATLLDLRGQRQGALRELGSDAARHPLARLWLNLDGVIEDQILILDEWQRLQRRLPAGAGFDEVHGLVDARLEAVQQRLRLWQQRLQAQTVPSPPDALFEPLDNLAGVEGDNAKRPELLPLPLATRRALATRLLLLNRLEQGLHGAELQWRAAMQIGLDG